MFKARPKINSVLPAPQCVTPEVWAQLVRPDGTLGDVAALRFLVKGGLEASLRPQVWPLLLGVLLPTDSTELAAAKREAAAAEYRRLLALAEQPEAAHAAYTANGATELWAATVRRIHMDTFRTAQEADLFMGAQREHSVALLSQLLLAYALADPQTGYCQGMADLAAPFLALFPADPASAFWCFRGLMQLGGLRENFQEGLSHVQDQMQGLCDMLRLADPLLHRHLRGLGAGGGEFAFQMLMVAFRRELSWQQIFVFWEVLWACEALAGCSLRVHAAAILLMWHRKTILGFDGIEELISFVNRMPRPQDPAHLARSACKLALVLAESAAAQPGGGAKVAAAAHQLFQCYPLESTAGLLWHQPDQQAHHYHSTQPQQPRFVCGCYYWLLPAARSRQRGERLPDD